MIISTIFLSAFVIIYAAVRGLLIWAERQPYEEDLWPTKGIGGPGVKKGTTDC